MINPPQNRPIILRDSREKQGYQFNKCSRCMGTEDCKLDYGDYQIKDHPCLIVIERKKSVLELCKNFGKERERFKREFIRMNEAGCKFKYVIVEDYYSSINRIRKYSRMSPTAIFESIIAFELKYNVHFIFAGTRKYAHDITRSLLLRAYEYLQEGII